MYQKCPICKGTGENNSLNGHVLYSTCKTCNGKGIICELTGSAPKWKGDMNMESQQEYFGLRRPPYSSGDSRDDNKLQEAVKTLKEALRTDEDYREGWKANIAMAFYDGFSNHMLKNHPTFKEEVESEVDIHEIANKSADNFLNLLCS